MLLIRNLKKIKNKKNKKKQKNQIARQQYKFVRISLVLGALIIPFFFFFFIIRRNRYIVSFNGR